MIRSLVNLLQRVAQLVDWTTDLSVPKSVWISGEHLPSRQKKAASVLQNVSAALILMTEHETDHALLSQDAAAVMTERACACKLVTAVGKPNIALPGLQPDLEKFW